MFSRGCLSRSLLESRQAVKQNISKMKLVIACCLRASVPNNLRANHLQYRSCSPNDTRCQHKERCHALRLLSPSFDDRARDLQGLRFAAEQLNTQKVYSGCPYHRRLSIGLFRCRKPFLPDRAPVEYTTIPSFPFFYRSLQGVLFALRLTHTAVFMS